MTKKFTPFIFVLIVLVISGCKGSKRFEASFITLFDTQTKIIGYMNSREEFEKTAQKAHDELSRYHKLYDIYNTYDGINNIKTINENAGKAPIKVDREIIDLLIFSKEAYALTGGRLNVAMGAVLNIWHDYRTRGVEDFQNAALPPFDILRQAAEHTDINDIIIDEQNSTVFLKDSQMSLDVGAVAKGYAAEKTAQFLIQNGVKSFLLSVGGNVRAAGMKQGNEKWNVGIKNPDYNSSEQFLKTIYLKDMSVVTSGSYQRYYTVNSKKYHHIIDPKTLMPSGFFEALTVICEDSGFADVLSTALFNMPYSEGEQFVKKLNGVYVLWVFNDGQIKYSRGFESFLK